MAMCLYTWLHTYMRLCTYVWLYTFVAIYLYVAIYLCGSSSCSGDVLHACTFATFWLQMGMLHALRLLDAPQGIMDFDTCRLEGRALEHALANDAGHGIRMKTPAGAFVVVQSPSAKAIRLQMKARSDLLLEELAARGLNRAGADLPFRLSREDSEALELDSRDMSVDLRLWICQRQGYALVEVKWTRGALRQAMGRARSQLGKLERAALNGVWLRSRHGIEAIAVGAMAAGSKSWSLELRGLGGYWTADYCSPGRAPVEPAPQLKCRPSGRSGWEDYKRKHGAAPGDEPVWLSNWEEHNAQRAQARALSTKPTAAIKRKPAALLKRKPAAARKRKPAAALKRKPSSTGRVLSKERQRGGAAAHARQST